MVDFLKEQIHQILDLVYLKVEQLLREPKGLVEPLLQLMCFAITKDVHLKNNCTELNDFMYYRHNNTISVFIFY